MLIDSEWTTPVAKDERRNSKSVWLSRLIVAAAVVFVVVVITQAVKSSLFVDSLGTPLRAPYYTATCPECGFESMSGSNSANAVFVCRQGHSSHADPKTVKYVEKDSRDKNFTTRSPGHYSNH